MSSILDKILAVKRDEVDALQARRAQIQAASNRMEPPRGFAAALRSRLPRAVIAEIKRASPSKGLIREDFDVAWLARRYAAGGAACLSVLTDRQFFQGEADYLAQARAACTLPVLRKDFIIDPLQVIEARMLGADCILLIAAALDDDNMQALARQAFDLGMDVLAEVHDATELQRVLQLPQDTIIGINNRNLNTFATTLDTSMALRTQVPAERLLISESGIYSAADIRQLAEHEIGAFLIGESFMRAPDPGTALAELLAT
ncbi:MAG TPA: indole-3-glycerol phosphate synthase TrpC [Salinisphaeraceae bacterium]|nr:indole-3-glycerol phosphate synthase TrpC [Salinisphaeraceae bacterium]